MMVLEKTVLVSHFKNIARQCILIQTTSLHKIWERKYMFPSNTYISSSTKRIFWFSASMAFISSLLSEKSNIWKSKLFLLKRVHEFFLSFSQKQSLCATVNESAFWWPNLEVVFYPPRAEALRDHYHASLYIEAQSHLGTALVVLFPNGYKQLILQQGRTFQIHPKPKIGDNTKGAFLKTHMLGI